MDIRKFVTIVDAPPPPETGKSLLDRAAPAHSDDVLCPETTRAAARAWIERFGRRDVAAQKKMMLVSGPSGIGKTTLLRLLLREAGYHVHVVTAQTSRQSVLEAIGDMCPRTTAILLDDVDVMLETSAVAVQDVIMHVYPLKGRRSVTRAQKEEMAAAHWTFPVVATAKSHEYGKIVDFSKWCEVVPFPRPSRDRLVAHLATIVGPGVSQTNLRAIADASKRDVRNAIMALDFARVGASGRSALALSAKDNDIDAVNAVHMLIHADAPLTVATALRLAHVDTSIVPMMLFENYLDVAPSMEAAATAADAMALANVVEDRMYATGNFEMLDDYFGYAVAAPSFAVRAEAGPDKVHSSCLKKTRRTAAPPTVRFGNMWSRISNAHVRKAATNAIRDAMPVLWTLADDPVGIYDVLRTLRAIYERSMSDIDALAAIPGIDPATFVKVCRFGLTPPRASLVSMQTVQKRLTQKKDEADELRSSGKAKAGVSDREKKCVE